jgi:hypothetical protein
MARQHKTLKLAPRPPGPHTPRPLTDAADSCTVNVAGMVPLLPSTAGEPAVTLMFGA